TGVGSRSGITVHYDAHLIAGKTVHAWAVGNFPLEDVLPYFQLCDHGPRIVRVNRNTTSAHEVPRACGRCDQQAACHEHAVLRNAELLIETGISDRVVRIENEHGDRIDRGGAIAAFQGPGENVLTDR